MDLDIMKEKMDEFLEETEDRDFIVGDETSEIMARVALDILKSVREVQKYGIRERYFEEVC